MHELLPGNVPAALRRTCAQIRIGRRQTAPTTHPPAAHVPAHALAAAHAGIRC